MTKETNAPQGLYTVIKWLFNTSMMAGTMIILSTLIYYMYPTSEITAVIRHYTYTIGAFFVVPTGLIIAYVYFSNLFRRKKHKIVKYKPTPTERYCDFTVYACLFFLVATFIKLIAVSVGIIAVETAMAFDMYGETAIALLGVPLLVTLIWDKVVGKRGVKK